MIRTYSELITIPTYGERLRYCALHGRVSELTFGHNRYLNQTFYQNQRWKRFRRDIIIRDQGRDLAVEGYELDSYVYIHHLVPITVSDVLEQSEALYDPNNVVCVSFTTHNYIHYGLPNEDIFKQLADRKPNDTIPWR